MCQYCGNTGLCGVFISIVLIKILHWITTLFKILLNKFKKLQKKPA